MEEEEDLVVSTNAKESPSLFAAGAPSQELPSYEHLLHIEFEPEEDLVSEEDSISSSDGEEEEEEEAVQRGVRTTAIPVNQYPSNFPGGRAAAMTLIRGQCPPGTTFTFSQDKTYGPIPDNVIVPQARIHEVGNEHDRMRVKKTPKTASSGRTRSRVLCRVISCPNQSNGRKFEFCHACFNLFDTDQEAAEVCHKSMLAQYYTLLVPISNKKIDKITGEEQENYFP